MDWRRATVEYRLHRRQSSTAVEWVRFWKIIPEGSGFSGDLCHKTNPPTHNLD
jgi:hypothetical protein